MTERKKQILKIVVEHYIRTAEPVGSNAIAAQMERRVSSATIRNELAELTEMGYLEQPHTSAGRAPTPKGYRLYVDELMQRQRLSLRENIFSGAGTRSTRKVISASAGVSVLRSASAASSAARPADAVSVTAITAEAERGMALSLLPPEKEAPQL